MSLIDALKAEEKELSKKLKMVRRTIEQYGGKEVKKVKKFSAATRARMAKARKAFWAAKKKAEKV
jgi:hypothetical protein